MKRTAYEQHFRMLEHYSGLIFKARLAILSMSFAVFAYILIKPDTGDSSVLYAAYVSSKGLIAFLTSLFISLIYCREIGYYKRLYLVILSGRELEKDESFSSFFSSYKKSESRSISIVYGSMVLVFSLLFLTQIEYSKIGSFLLVLLFVLSSLPVALFFYICRVKNRSEKLLLHSSSEEEGS